MRKLNVVSQAESSSGKTFWNCVCECGEMSTVQGTSLGKGTKSCGCLRKDLKLDLIGQTFNRLTVISEAETKNNFSYWNCICECGKETTVLGSSLKNGNTKSCGCLKKETHTKHGMHLNELYPIWNSMKSRCLNQDAHDYKNYGARGITVCQRWLDIHNFIEDMGERPSKYHSIDRIDVNGNYEPSNCRWATPKEQSNNTRSNRYITFEGRTQTLTQWSEELGINSEALNSRLENGWTIEDAFTTSITKGREITYLDKTQTITQWSEELGISVSALYNRFSYGWTVERAFTTPVRTKRKVV
jgi:hypothetical protein